MSAWGCEKKMICWSDDMIWRYDDMIRRSEDMIIWWSDDMTTLSGLLFMAAITLLFFSFCRPAVRHLISIQHLTPNEFQMRGECLVWRSRCMCSTRLLPKYKYPWVTSIGPSTLPQITHGKFCQLNILGCRYSIAERSTSTVAQCRSSRASQKWLSLRFAIFWGAWVSAHILMHHYERHAHIVLLSLPKR